MTMGNVKSEGSDQIGKEIDDLVEKNEEQDERLDAIEARLAALEEGGGDVDPPDPPDPPDPEPETGVAPREWNDPRFVNMTERTSPYTVQRNGEVIENLSIKTTSTAAMVDSREGYSYSLKNCRFDGGEGPRISGRGTYNFEDVLVLFKGSGDAHADGIQDYGPGQAPTVNMKRVGSRAKGQGANNAACMFVDNAKAIVDIDSCDFDGQYCPSKGLFIANNPAKNDIGVQSLKVRNTILRNGTRFEGDLNVKEWTGNTDGNGNPINSPSPVRP